MPVMLLFWAAVAAGAGDAADPPLRWVPPASLDVQLAGLGLPELPGVTHTVIFDPRPCRGNVDEGGDGRYESLLHGTYSHHQRIVIAGDRFIVYWTNHSRDENGPGQRMLARVGRFNADRSVIDWGGPETMVELAPPPAPVRRRFDRHDPDVLFEGYATATLQLIGEHLYVRGYLLACNGYTDDVQYHGTPGQPIPAEHWRDQRDRQFKWDMWWRLGLDFVQRWRIAGPTLVPDSPLYKLSEPVGRVEVTPGRFKTVPPPLEPYASARPFAEAPEALREEVLRGRPAVFGRSPRYAPGTSKLAADGRHGLAHHTEFRRPDGRWVVVRDNLINPGHYYAAAKERAEDVYPPATETNLLGHGMPVAGELPDGRPWIIGNSAGRKDMFLTLSRDGVVFDRTWLLLHSDRRSDGGLFKGGGPQYFQAETVGDRIWVVYSISKEQVGVTGIPIGALAD